MAQINFGLLNTDIPAQIGAIPGNALAMRRQIQQQEEDRAAVQEGRQMQNALARMQMTKAQSDMDEEAAYKAALGGVQGGNYEQAMPSLMQASPSRAMGLQKTLTDQQKAIVEMRKSTTEMQDKKLGIYRENLTGIQTPEQMAQWYVSQRNDPDLVGVQWPTTLDETLTQLSEAAKSPQGFGKFKLAVAGGLKGFLEMNKPAAPSALGRMISERDALPQGDPRRADYDRAIAKETTHAPGASVNVGFPKEQFKNERDLRNDFAGLPTTKAFKEVQTAYDQIQTAAKNPSPANDLAAATKFMKLLDPDSVVRESELAMAMQATGMWDRVTNYHNRLIKGEKLTPSQREDFLRSADGLYQAAAGRFNAQADEYRGMAEDYGLNPDRIAKPASNGRPQTPSMKNPRGWTLHTDANGNRAYVSPDGSQFEEVR